MDEHTEEQTIGTSQSTFTNSDAAVDISGWGLVEGDMYMVRITVDDDPENGDPGDDVWVEVNFVYEKA